MLRKRIGRRWSALAIGVLAGGTLAGGVVAAQFRDAASLEELDASLRDDPLVRIADIPAANGLPSRGVFVQSTAAGFVCLWDAPSAGASKRQGGCNSADDPLGGRKLFISFAYDGGPAVADIRDARLIGLASADVAAVKVVMSDGTARNMPLRTAALAGRRYLAFGYRVSQGDLRREVTPRAVLAVNGAGEEIDRQATGVAG